MKKIISLTLVMVIAIVTMGLLSCSSQTSSGQATDSGKNAAIEEVKDSLTTEIVGSYKAVKYEDGYVVSDLATSITRKDNKSKVPTKTKSTATLLSVFFGYWSFFILT